MLPPHLSEWTVSIFLRVRGLRPLNPRTSFVFTHDCVVDGCVLLSLVCSFNSTRGCPYPLGFDFLIDIFHVMGFASYNM